MSLGWEESEAERVEPEVEARPAQAIDAVRVRSLVLFLLAAGGVWVVGLMLRPFLPAVVTSAVVAVLVLPIYRRVARRIAHRNLAALLTTVVVFFLGLIPTVVVSLLLLEEIRDRIAWLGSDLPALLGPAGPLTRWSERVAAHIGVEATDVAAVIAQQAQALVSMLVSRTVNLFTGLGGWLLQAGVALFTLFYLLRDGDNVLEYVKWLLPLDAASNDRLFRRAGEITHATVFGSLVVAFVQAALGGISFWALDLPAPIVWAALMGILSILPAVGAWFVWLPAGILLLFGGHVIKGIILLAIGAFLISTVDNVLRTLLVSDRAHLHPLVAFFSVLGGLFVFGAAGVFIGPVLFVMALTLVEIARLSLEPTSRVPRVG